MRNLFTMIATVATLCVMSIPVSALADDIDKVAHANLKFMMPMRDGVRLTTDIYIPKNTDGKKLPVIFWKTPYNMNELEGTRLKFAMDAVSRGYVFVMQNERGRYFSEGKWEILGNPRTDGYDALSWIADQKWSNGKVGTIGCSSSAEWQLALAAMDHPAHEAMVPMAAGAGIGRVGEFQEQGNWYKGGVHQTLFSIWLSNVQQDQWPRFSKGISQEDLQRLSKQYDLAAKRLDVEWKDHVKRLPMTEWLTSIGANKGPFADMVKRKPNDPAWFEGGLYHDNEPWGVPALWFNSWYDVSQGPNLALFNHAREKGADAEVRDNQFVVVAPTGHCGFYRIPDGDLTVGERNMGDANFPMEDIIYGFFDERLKGEDNGFSKDTPRVQYYNMGDKAWKTADSWPPKASKPVTMYLSSDGDANSLYGGGVLQDHAPDDDKSDTYIYDPFNPVPALGGGVCCNGGAASNGSWDQRSIEARRDVLVYTSDVLSEDVDVTGSIYATLYVSSDVKDTDFTIKLVDVHPDGTAYNVDDTIQRARYREGYDKEVMMKDGEVYKVKLSAMSTSLTFKKGHRIRVEVSSSKFPQYMRNLNTGGNNYDETTGVVAHNSIHHSAKYPSHITLPVIAD